MANFETAITKVLAHEGGYANVSGDTGGETYRGITRKNNPTWSGWKIIDQKPRKRNEIIPQVEQLVKDWYQSKYWKFGGICNDHVAGFVFDWFVNSGNHAIVGLQRVVGAVTDGILGNNTIAKTNNFNGDLLSLLIAERIKFVKNIVSNNPTQGKFLAGWLNRINSFNR